MMKSQSLPVTPKQPIPAKGAQSNSILQSLKDRLRGDRSKSRNLLSLSNNAIDSPCPRGTQDSNSMLSPVESPIQSPALSEAGNYMPSSSPLRESATSPSVSPSKPSPPPPRMAFTEPVHTNAPRSEVPPNDAHETLLLRQIPLTFAVDVSGSTSGRILREEQNAILAVSSTFDRPDLASRSTILPWSHKARSPVDLTDIEDLHAGGGTDPGVLLEDPVCKSRLQESNLWFLLTDGFIEEPLVHKFANAIPAAGVHGTACVITLFGYAETSPFECNVSVGMSVFAVAPHCIFLFHNVRTSKVYVFQAKGCFTSILPEKQQFASFGDWTQWSDLVQITYRELGQVKVPSATKLSEDTVLLPDERQFNLNDIYNDTLSEADKLDLLSDYSALDVIILAAKTRGKESEVKAWISKARSARESEDHTSRQAEDIGGKARVIILALIKETVPADITTIEPELKWETLRALSSSPDVQAMKSKLRYQHLENWRRFELKHEAQCDLSSKMNEVFDDVLMTMSVYENAGSRSPAMLTPMTSPSPTISSVLGESRQISREPQQRSQRQSPLRKPLGPYSVDRYMANYSRSRHEPATRTASASLQARNLLFLPGFKGSRTFSGRGPPPPNYNTCAVCGQENSIQVLLLQTNRESEETPHFPRPNSQSKHKYPMVLGNYPETDVIIPLTACDACAFLMLQEEELPNGGHVDAVLPLVSLRNVENRRQWLDILNKLFEHRFHERIALLVFLSSVCSTIEDLVNNDEPNSHGLRQSLEWCCRAMCEIPGVSTMAGFTPASSPISAVIDDSVPLERTLSLAFSPGNPIADTITMESPFLAYPIEGFVAIVQLASLLEDIEPYMIELFVWKRLLYHLTERHVELRKQLSPKEANTKLKTIIFEPFSPSTSNLNLPSSMPSNPKLSFSISILTDTYLIPSPSDTIDQFQRMGEFFSPIETTTKYQASLAVFLHTLLNESAADELGLLDATELPTRIRYRTDKVRCTAEGLYDIFEDPKLVVEDMAARLIEEDYRL